MPSSNFYIHSYEKNETGKAWVSERIERVERSVRRVSSSERGVKFEKRKLQGYPEEKSTKATQA